MKPGARALGVAESYTDAHDRSTLAGAVVRADRVLDGLVFGSCAVGGTDATAAIAALCDRLGRDDLQYVLLSGIAPAWFNLIDLPALAEAVAPPVLSVSFEESEGLEPALRREFEGDALEERLAVYERQPPRERVVLDGVPRFVRAVGLGDEPPRAVLEAFTPEGEGGRPEPLRVARVAARAAAEWCPEARTRAQER